MSASIKQIRKLVATNKFLHQKNPHSLLFQIPEYLLIKLYRTCSKLRLI